jgi:hypothetical protein
LAAPELYGSDRGFFSEQNLASCKHAGVKLVCIPQRSGKRTPRRQAYESSAAFENGQRFRRHRGTHLGAVPRPRHEALSALNHPDLVVEPLDEAERDLVLKPAVGGDPESGAHRTVTYLANPTADVDFA